MLCRDKLLLYIIVLTLTISGYTYKLNMLSEDLKVTLPILSNLAREAGCKVTKDGTSTIMELTAPLTFPPPKLHKAK